MGRIKKAVIYQIVFVGLSKMGVWAGCVCVCVSFAGHLLSVTMVKLQVPALCEMAAVQGYEESEDPNDPKSVLNDPRPVCCSSCSVQTVN